MLKLVHDNPTPVARPDKTVKISYIESGKICGVIFLLPETEWYEGIIKKAVTTFNRKFEYEADIYRGKPKELIKVLENLLGNFGLETIIKKDIVKDYVDNVNPTFGVRVNIGDIEKLANSISKHLCLPYPISNSSDILAGYLKKAMDITFRQVPSNINSIV